MTDTMTLTGVVATVPRHITTNAGLDITSFRLASSQRRFDRDRQKWVETDTNWYTVTGFRQLAQNMAASIEQGQRIVVSGRVRIRPWENAERSGTTIEIEADALGHDLGWGTAVWARVAPAGAGVGSSSGSGSGLGSGSGGDGASDTWAHDTLAAGLEPAGGLRDPQQGQGVPDAREPALASAAPGGSADADLPF
ncbi:single-stranded DNA-binding protein [Herbiconiux sp. VKM Ac-1786]|uniref:single-stranded DNA-binding protein n=1 Tax=Herbiconiux sp. VKM Ac-1786 TaxID=2783824 RepID=UPI00188BA821|nr:single-stranded DNA-binding protein [Herbiconiux sp. VKM Ac-1786]MBF4571005.1 single-stranded DNA-binding protein [Herbiconiux sp. VKM Ac-1786]